MLTIATLRAANFITPWNPAGSHLPKRSFYYSAQWRDAFQRLPSRVQGRRVRWWDEADEGTPDAGTSWPSGKEMADLFIDPSIRGRLSGLVETFVRGWPREKLIRRDGFGMDPPFKRMRSPLSAVVEMRTEHTRTFGFFVGPGVFVAHRLDLAENTHANPELYQGYAADVLRMLARIAVSDKDESSDVESLIGNF